MVLSISSEQHIRSNIYDQVLGSYAYSLKVNKETSQIVLNSLELDLDKILLWSTAAETTVQAPSWIQFDTVQQRAIFNFGRKLPANSIAQLQISFKADITGRLAGYYKSTGGADGKTIYALTQFQACPEQS